MRSIKKLIAVVFLFAVINAKANDTTKLYNPSANVAADVMAAVKKAKKEGKHVMLQIGGNWCSWCYKYENFVKADTALHNILEKNYVVYHLNYSKENMNLDYLAKLGFPQRFGFPVFVVLDDNGKQIHTQNSALLEKEKSYDADKVKEFLLGWTKEALNPANYKE